MSHANAVRTALLNERPWGGLPSPGEEYVPADYVPRRLPAALAAARDLLFGPDSDRAGRNVTLARLLAFLHASPFAADVTAADPRVTYDPAGGPGLFAAVGPTVTGAGAVGWRGVAGFVAAGRAYGRWQVTTDGSGGWTAVDAGGVPAAGSVAVTSGGNVVPLPGSSLGLVVTASTAGEWVASLYVPPAHPYAALAGLTDAAALFRPAGDGLDRRLYETWLGDGPAALRAAAAALALARRTLELGD